MKWDYNKEPDNTCCIDMTNNIKDYIEREIASMTCREMTEYMHKAYLEYDLAVSKK